jgi:hypothetical protein
MLRESEMIRGRSALNAPHEFRTCRVLVEEMVVTQSCNGRTFTTLATLTVTLTDAEGADEGDGSEGKRPGNYAVYAVTFSCKAARKTCRGISHSKRIESAKCTSIVLYNQKSASRSMYNTMDKILSKMDI